jgi:hypothetical protein
VAGKSYFLIGAVACILHPRFAPSKLLSLHGLLLVHKSCILHQKQSTRSNTSAIEAPR